VNHLPLAASSHAFASRALMIPVRLELEDSLLHPPAPRTSIVPCLEIRQPLRQPLRQGAAKRWDVADRVFEPDVAREQILGMAGSGGKGDVLQCFVLAGRGITGIEFPGRVDELVGPSVGFAELLELGLGELDEVGDAV
jgi:hypothetical protein